MTKQLVLEHIHKNLLIGIVRGSTVEETIAFAKAYIEGGIATLEVSSAGAYPAEVIRRLKETYGDRVIIGAGTVLDDVTARIMMLAGADFIAAPSCDAAVAKMCNRYQVFYMPACFTSNEIAAAMQSGIHIVKVYPGELYPVKTVAAMKNLYTGLDIIAAGGATYENIGEWLDIGVWAVGVVFSADDLDLVRKKSAQFAKKIAESENC